jgi:hypothetical protein
LPLPQLTVVNCLIGKLFLAGCQQQLVAPYFGNHTIERGQVASRIRVAQRIAEQRSILVHLKQVPALLTGMALQLQHYFAAKANVFVGNDDGIPGKAAPLALLNTGLGVFEFELRRVFLLLKLHECTYVVQLCFNSARVGGKCCRGKVGVGQGNKDLTAPNFEMWGTLSQAAVANKF